MKIPKIYITIYGSPKYNRTRPEYWNFFWMCSKWSVDINWVRVSLIMSVKIESANNSIGRFTLNISRQSKKIFLRTYITLRIWFQMKSSNTCFIYSRLRSVENVKNNVCRRNIRHWMNAFDALTTTSFKGNFNMKRINQHFWLCKWFYHSNCTFFLETYIIILFISTRLEL